MSNNHWLKSMTADQKAGNKPNIDPHKHVREREVRDVSRQRTRLVVQKEDYAKVNASSS